MTQSFPSPDSDTSTSAADLLHEAERLRQRARRDGHRTSVPLFIFGALIIVAGLLEFGTDYGSRFSTAGLLMPLATPVALAFLAWWFRRQQRRVGVGHGPARPLVVAGGALCLILLAPLTFFLPLLLPTVLAMAGLLVLGLWQRDRFLVGCAVIFGVLLGLEAFFVLSNRLYDLASLLGLFADQDGYFSGASGLVVTALGALLLLAGVAARRLENLWP